jgi:hypothetical protein
VKHLKQLSLFFCLLVICIHSLLLIKNAKSNFPNVDELAHLPAGVSHWRFEKFDLYRVNPPLVRIFATVPLVERRQSFEWHRYSEKVGKRPEFTIATASLRKYRTSLQGDFVLPRLLSLSFSFFSLGILAVWIKGPSRILLVVLWCFSPNILAHAPTVVPDIGSVATGLLAWFLTASYVRRPSFANASLVGVAIGVALLTKLTLLPSLLFLPLCVASLQCFSPSHFPLRSLPARTIDTLLFLFFGIFVLNLGYLFEGSFLPLGVYEFCSEMLGGAGCNAGVQGNRFRETWLASFPVPVPRNYLLGIDYLKYEVEAKKWSFLNGEWKYGSWSNYYIITTLYKTPEPTLVAALVGLWVLVTGIRRKMVEPEVISMFLFLIIPAAVCFASVSLQGGFNHHHRYVLMIYPPMFALAAYVASPVAVQLLRFRLPLMGPTKRSIAIPLAVTLVVLSAASSLRVHPYYTSYFNTLSGGPENGWRLLGFSNIDWGQDILEVDKWLKAHPDRRPLVMDLDYFGMNGKLFDVPTSDPPQLPKHASIDEVRSSITETQWWIISVKKLYNYPGHHGLEYLQQLEPVDKIAYAYHVYRIDPLPPLETGRK